MDFTANSELEVLVGDFAVLVRVKLVENVLELFIRQVETPMAEVEPKLLGHDAPRLLHVQVHECLPQGLPLELDLVKHCLLQQMLVCHLVLCYLELVLVQRVLVLLQVLVKLRVFNGIVSKVKSFALVNAVSYPFGEISVTYHSLLSGILVFDELF